MKIHEPLFEGVKLRYMKPCPRATQTKGSGLTTLTFCLYFVHLSNSISQRGQPANGLNGHSNIADCCDMRTGRLPPLIPRPPSSSRLSLHQNCSCKQLPSHLWFHFKQLRAAHRSGTRPAVHVRLRLLLGSRRPKFGFTPPEDCGERIQTLVWGSDLRTLVRPLKG